MAEETTNVEALAADDATSQADNNANASNANASTEQPQAADSAKDDFVPKSELNKKNAENKSLRERAKAAEEELQKIRDADLTESQRLQKQLEEVSSAATKREANLRSLLLTQSVTSVAAANGARPTALRAIAKLVDPENLEFDLESLSVNGVEDEIKRLKKEDPDLFIIGGTNGGAGNSTAGRPTGSMNDLIRGSLRR